MRPESVKFLEDIIESGETILEIAAGKSLDSYRAEKVTRLAVERCFEVIGEAMRRLADLDPGVAGQITDHARIIAFRNVLIHGYSLIKHELVLSVVENELPRLLREARELLPPPRAE